MPITATSCSRARTRWRSRRTCGTRSRRSGRSRRRTTGSRRRIACPESVPLEHEADRARHRARVAAVRPLEREVGCDQDVGLRAARRRPHRSRARAARPRWCRPATLTQRRPRRPQGPAGRRPTFLVTCWSPDRCGRPSPSSSCRSRQHLRRRPRRSRPMPTSIVRRDGCRPGSIRQSKPSSRPSPRRSRRRPPPPESWVPTRTFCPTRFVRGSMRVTRRVVDAQEPDPLPACRDRQGPRGGDPRHERSGLGIDARDAAVGVDGPHRPGAGRDAGQTCAWIAPLRRRPGQPRRARDLGRRRDRGATR